MDSCNVAKAVEKSEIADSMIVFYVCSLAKHGFNPKLKSEAYRIRKEKEGWKKWDDLSLEDRENRKEQALVKCECIEENKKPDRFCFLCKGSGKRMMTSKEKDAFEYGLVRRQDELDRAARGEDSCVKYVMDSIDKMNQTGAWHDPLPTDGWHVDKSIHRDKGPRTVVTLPVKIYKGKELVGIVEKQVVVSAVKSKCRDEWKPLLKMLREHERLFRAELSELTNPRAIRKKKIQIEVVRSVIGRLTNVGNAINREDVCRKILFPHEFENVEHLWM